MKPVEQILSEAWADERVYKNFSRAIKRKLKTTLDVLQWEGKDDGKPHPLFKEWIYNNKL